MIECTGPIGPPLTGRLLELEQVGALLDQAAGGEARTILISGSAGVGKTTLVTAATSGREAIVTTGACLPLVSVTVPFIAIRAAMANVPATTGNAVDGAGTVAGDESAVPGRFDSWLDELCVDGPVILVVEDLHWADQFTLDTLMYVIAGPASRRLAVVATMRHDELADGHRLQRWLADVRRLPRFSELRLDPFDRLETAEQLGALLGELPHLELVEDVYRRSAGNPLLTRLLAAGLAPDARRVADAIPSELRSAVLHAWFGMEQPVRDVVTILAIGGRPMRPAELAVIASEDAGALADHLTQAVAAGVLASSRDGTFWFRHPLNAEVLADAVPAHVQSRWHATLATLLESGLADRPGDVSAVAEHLFRAGDFDAAYGWSLRAAAWHESQGAHGESLRMLGRALALSDKADAAESVDDLLVRIRAAAAKAGAQEEELRTVEALLQRTPPATLPGAVAELLVRRTQLRLATGRAFFEEEDLREAVRLTAPEPASWEHALALSELAHAELWRGNPDGVEHAREALLVARAAGDDRALSLALSTSAFASVSVGDWAGGRRIAAEAIDVGFRSGDWWACTTAIVWQANCTDEPLSEVARLLSSGRARLAITGAPYAYQAWIASIEASCLFITGAWQECAARLREAVASNPGVNADVSARLCAARLAVWQGRQREAEQHLARADELVAQHSEFLGFDFDVVRAEVRLGAGDPDAAYLAALAGMGVPGSEPLFGEWLVPLAARALADRAQAVRDGGDAPSVQLARADQLQAAHPAVIRDASAASEAYERQCRALDALYAAELSRTREGPREHELWMAAADSLESVGLAWEEAYACRRGAEALLSNRHDRATGAALLRRALNRAERLAAEPLVEQLQALAVRARVSTRRAVASADDVPTGRVRITPREREILALLVSGRTYGEIASELVISEKTVGSHISNLLAKTGTSNRVELAGYAERAHLTAG